MLKEIRSEIEKRKNGEVSKPKNDDELHRNTYQTLLLMGIMMTTVGKVLFDTYMTEEKTSSLLRSINDERINPGLLPDSLTQENNWGFSFSGVSEAVTKQLAYLSELENMVNSSDLSPQIRTDIMKSLKQAQLDVGNVVQAQYFGDMVKEESDQNPIIQRAHVPQSEIDAAYSERDTVETDLKSKAIVAINSIQALSEKLANYEIKFDLYSKLTVLLGLIVALTGGVPSVKLIRRENRRTLDAIERIYPKEKRRRSAKGTLALAREQLASEQEEIRHNYMKNHDGELPGKYTAK